MLRQLPRLAAVAAVLTFAASAALAEEHVIDAHPALWTVHGPKGTAYLLGSIHILPPNVHWKTPEIVAAMKKADTFVFEIPLDHQEQDAKKLADVQKAIMDHNGLLPERDSLRAQLPKSEVADYDAALTTLEISPGYVDRLQPWLAAMVLENAQLLRTDFDGSFGVDRQIYTMASAAHKKTQGLETLEDQINVITPAEQTAGTKALGEQIASVKSGSDEKQIDAILSAWSKGDVDEIDDLSTDDLGKDPAFKSVLLDNRNRRWVGELKTMLQSEHVYFITVGAAHLAGVGGVPSLMRAAGYRVDGPVAKAPPAPPQQPKLRTASE